MGFEEGENCPIFYHKWVSKRPLVHLLTQKFRFKRGQKRSNLAKVHQTDIYAKTPEIRGFPVFCRQIGLKYGKNQRLDNSGAWKVSMCCLGLFFVLCLKTAKISGFQMYFLKESMWCD